MKKMTPLREKYSKNELNVIILVLLLLLLYTSSLNVLIPSYSPIIEDFGIKNSLIYLPDSLSVLISAFIMILWGYYTDRIDRNKIIIGGAFLAVIGFIGTAFCQNFLQLLFARILTGAGLGFALPVAYSVLSDIIPSEERAGLFGFLAIFSAISNGLGQFLSAFLGPLNIFVSLGLLQYGWQFPFLILTILAIIITIMLFFVKLPAMGSKEESLSRVNEFEEMEYGYKINQKELFNLLHKRTNKALIINGFFSIVPGTIIIFSLIMTFSHSTEGMFRELPGDIRTQVSTIMAGMTSAGYMLGSIVLSWLGDIVYKKKRQYRALLAFITNVIAIPLVFLMIFQLEPVSLTQLGITYPESIAPEDQVFFMFETMKAIFTTYPKYITYLIFSFFGTFFSAGMVTNKNAVMIDVNLPEHRGTATSFFQLTEQIGKSITLLIAAGLLQLLGSYKNMLYMGILFWIPSAIFWYISMKSVVKDSYDKDLILRERAQITFFDFFFEVELALDDGVQLIQDAKDILVLKPKKAEKLIDRAVNKFIWIMAKAHQKNLLVVEKRAQKLLNKSVEFQEDLGKITTSAPYAQLQELFMKIDALWEESDFGNIEILYDSAYLKVCEARLRRFYNPIECSQILEKSIEIYNRVVRLASDRLIEEGAKKLSDEEKALQLRISQLLVNSQKSRSNTELLKQKLDEIVIAVMKEGISRNDLMNLMEITDEYGLKLQDIINETFDKRVARKINRAINQIDDIFKEYDLWQSNE
ncbi:hypothetical protein NEF87_000757 [Candidatus Lokiarchaeum ossiferum]|uniref:Major facilitator superfamily (MFS) profile domain-containing protein n=1 Tax=Candidatus Lokiarchaeum ossiferum TaxID=2951803 RepID=A0ABY6HNL3_9ARCH|nr:hypothetical protein NEF87_000757 [Candidatus Lokiarchaeum sp. B-35]